MMNAPPREKVGGINGKKMKDSLGKAVGPPL